MTNSPRFGMVACVFAGLGLAVSLWKFGSHFFLVEQPSDYIFAVPFSLIGLVSGLTGAFRKEAKSGFYTYGIFLNALLILPMAVGYIQLGAFPHLIPSFPFLAYD